MLSLALKPHFCQTHVSGSLFFSPFAFYVLISAKFQKLVPTILRELKDTYSILCRKTPLKTQMLKLYMAKDFIQP